ncbi:tRNA (adenosine(37)-N6)-dimethylallyltransferase MiaA [bacterium]|nr:tRNA (adenosine(37)-N6)-dimethylallyltransferase MiaA [Patescibacteria group bacterium]MBU1958057.1 tRNA (adenosine(37)-N6)-dimethylallyltransferase MiaA [bacterium]
MKKVGQGRLPRVVCVVGPTASGKTTLSLRLARLFSGEIVNSDARQCYTDFGIGTGKPVGKRGIYEGRRAYMVQGIPHYMMDFLPPFHILSVAEWRKSALRAIKGITARKHLPIVVGGTGLYVKALVDNFVFPKVEAKPHLRAAFEKKSLGELVELLLKLDPAAAEVVDLKNPRRVIRALEVVTFTGKSMKEHRKVGKPVVEAFQIGMKWPRAVLFQRIDNEIEDMIERGWIDEIREIIRKKIPLDAPAMTSIGYRDLYQYIRGEKTLEQAIAACKISVHGYAKRQETWYKRDPHIHWARGEDEAVEMVTEWLSTK